MPRETRNPVWIDRSILAACLLFIFVLILAAVFEPSIRVLHTFQALIYVAVIPLTRRQSSYGFGAAVLIASFWNYTNIFVTTFVSGGIHELALVLHTGHLTHPDRIIALGAAGAHLLLIVAALAGFLRLHPGASAWLKFFLGGIVAVLSFVAMIYTTGRQYIPLVRHVFHLA